jgi:hypothetical protein
VTTAATLAPGSYPLTVVATGGGLRHTATVTLVLPAPPDFSLAVSPSTRTVNAGTQRRLHRVTVAALNGFTGTVTLSVSGLPAGATATFTLDPVGVPGTSTLFVRTTGSTIRSTYTLRVTGTTGTLSHQVTVTLTVR